MRRSFAAGTHVYKATLKTPANTRLLCRQTHTAEAVADVSKRYCIKNRTRSTDSFCHQPLGVTRQIFFVGSGNFDTHGDQLDLQAALLGQLSPALGAFYQALTEMNLADAVTTFTCSDFAPALQPNSAGGTDHAWGSHHIIMGGAVTGGKVYGTFPTLALGGPDDAGVNGRWVPTTASAQYAATLAQGFGLAAADLPYVLPYIGNFSSDNLGFLG
jgi:uncharacterized protein (DUF1501 family)